jgi:YggT family protein
MSWLGGTYSPPGQIAYRLTEWFLGPLRGVLPSIGMVDISPMVAYFGLSLLRGIVLGAM